jgi:hypothetical protein
VYQVVDSHDIDKSGEESDVFLLKLQRFLNLMEARGFDLVAVEKDNPYWVRPFYIFKDRSHQEDLIRRSGALK